MQNNIFIPNKIKAGFQERKDTYTGRLAYVIYYDQNNKLRKEASWNSWRDEDMEPLELNNVPTSGFVLNKKAGGYNSGWNYRQTYCRVYDPRGFEFEISIANLLYILENTNCVKGKGLEGEFVYGWAGTELVLIPTSSPDYIELVAFNSVVHNNKCIGSKELIVGATYMTKHNKKYIYMGNFDYYDFQYRTIQDGKEVWYKRHKDIPLVKGSGWRGLSQHIENEFLQNVSGKAFFFFVPNERGGVFIHKTSINKLLISTVDANRVSNYADLYEKLEHYHYFSPIDDSKELIVPYTFKEFTDIVEEQVANGMYARFYNKDENYFCMIPSNGKYRFGHAQTEPEWDLVEAFDKIQPVHFDRYLKNGKFYGIRNK